jgi:hypothetical protein
LARRNIHITPYFTYRLKLPTTCILASPDQLRDVATTTSIPMVFIGAVVHFVVESRLVESKKSEKA